MYLTHLSHKSSHKCSLCSDAVTVEVGSEVQLTCVIPSENHTISWRFIPANQSETNLPRDLTDEEYEITNKGDKSLLTVSDIQEYDSGSYICETELPASTDTSSTSVLLIAVPGTSHETFPLLLSCINRYSASYS